MAQLTLGVIRSSRKENERRAPIHPAHLPAIPAKIRSRLVFERGYGEPFGVSDDSLTSLGPSCADRREILGEAGVVLLPKPQAEDLEELKQGGTLWGWPHCVQQERITQVAIDRKLTLIAWEAMFLWKQAVRDMHLFYRNNEMAGYCSVIHALERAGLDGHYGEPLRAVVLSLGSASRGAVRAMRGRGIGNITVYTQRPPYQVHDQVIGCRYGQIVTEEQGLTTVAADGTRRPLVEVLTEADVIVNGILQDTDHPLMFLGPDDAARMKPGTLIVDVSCDEAMGFPFARPTSFDQPTFEAGRTTYYAVDHSPSYLWRSASWELSRVVIPFLETVLGGPGAWKQNSTIQHAIEIQDGRIQNEKILAFQGREAEFPHRLRG